MDITVYFGDLKPAKVVQEDVASLMLESFERFRSYIRCVSVTVTDINGPKGGIDKQCRCVLQLKRMAPIVVQDRDDSFVTLLNRVANRAAHALSQKIDRKQTSYRSRGRRQPSAGTTLAEEGTAPFIESIIQPDLIDVGRA